MSHYHILERAVDYSSCVVIAHIPTPAVNNIGGTKWANVMRMINQTSDVPLIERKFPDELRAIQNGSLLEVKFTVQFVDNDPSDSNEQEVDGEGIPVVDGEGNPVWVQKVKALTKAQRLAQIKAAVVQKRADITNKKSDLYAEKLIKYEWYGYSGDVNG